LSPKAAPFHFQAPKRMQRWPSDAGCLPAEPSQRDA
jgi:hypothetical protein